MPSRTIICAFALTLVSAAVIFAAVFPKPKEFTDSWELTFEPGVPKRIVVLSDGDQTPQAYWYLPYTITNNTKDAIDYLPEVELLTKDGRLHRANNNIPLAVYEKIKEVERNKLLEPQNKVAGKILVGEDQARDTVVIWRETTAEMGKFSIFVTGLSGEKVALFKKGTDFLRVMTKEEQATEERAGRDVSDTVSVEELTAEQRKSVVVFRKTLKLNFHINGDEVFPGEDDVNENAQEWIMR